MTAVEKRQKLERMIARRVLLDMKAAGYLMNIDNGADGDYSLLKPTNDVKALLGAMFQTDEERLYVFKEGQNRPFGWVFFVYGNDGWDVVCDYTLSLDEQMAGAKALADKHG